MNHGFFALLRGGPPRRLTHGWAERAPTGGRNDLRRLCRGGALGALGAARSWPVMYLGPDLLSDSGGIERCNFGLIVDGEARLAVRLRPRADDLSRVGW